MHFIAELHIRHSGWINLTLILVSVLACIGLSRVTFDSDPRVMFRSEKASYLRLLEFYKNYGEDDQDCILLIQGEALTTVEGLTSLHSLVLEIGNDSEIESVVSIFSARRPSRPLPFMLIDLEGISEERFLKLRETMSQHPVIKGQLLSEDGRTTIVSARLMGSKLSVDELEKILNRLQRLIAQHLEPHNLHCDFVGHPSVRISVLKSLKTEVLRFTLLGALVSGCIALVVFRSLTVLIVALLGPWLGVLWTLGAMGWLGISVDPLLVILPTLLFVVGFTDAFHLLKEVSVQVTSGRKHREAIAIAVRQIGPACALTALTTSIGFSSLSAAGTVCIQRFGLTCAGGTLITFLAIQLSVPSLMSTKWCEGRTKNSTPSKLSFSLLMHPLFQWLIDRHRATAFVGVSLVGVCLLFSQQLQADLKWLETLPRQSPVVTATEKCDRLFGGAFSAYVVVHWPEGTAFNSDEVMQMLHEVHQVCDQQLSGSRSFSILNVLESITPPGEVTKDQIRHLSRMPKEILSRLVNTKLGEAVITLHVPDSGAKTLEPKFEELKEKLGQLANRYPDSHLELTGTIVVASENVYQIIRDLSSSLTIASILIFLVMVTVFRSFGVGLLTVIPNILPQTLTAFVLVIAGEPLTITTVLTFSLCLGLSVDDTVHFLMRYLEERRESIDDRQALLQTFSSAGNAMLATSLVLMGGFAVMSVSSMPGVRWFSILSCTTLLAAMIGDLVLLPALLLCFPLRRVP